MVRSKPPPVLGRSRALVDPAMRAAVDRLNDAMRAPARYHFGWTDLDGNELEDGGGKGVRPALAILSAEAAGADASVALPGAVAVELIHNFSLLHDDIIDGDVERRHRPTVWSVWGIPDAIIVGDALHALGIESLLASDAPGSVEAARRLAMSTSAMIAGQSDDMTFDKRPEVTFEDCLTMEANKTGALIAFSASVGAVLAEAEPPVVAALETFGASLGLAFQAVDDILGIWGDPAVTGKASGNDLRERKRSMPVTAALASGHPVSDEIARLYASETSDDESMQRLAELIADAGGRERTEREATAQLERALTAIDSIDLHEPAADELRGLAGFIVERDF